MSPLRHTAVDGIGTFDSPSCLQYDSLRQRLFRLWRRLRPQSKLERWTTNAKLREFVSTAPTAGFQPSHVLQYLEKRREENERRGHRRSDTNHGQQPDASQSGMG